MRTDFDYSPYYYKKSGKDSGINAKERKAPPKIETKKTRTRYSPSRKRAIAVCSLIIAVSIICYIVFSSKSVPAAQRVSLPAVNYYGISLGTYADHETAKVQALSVRARGAAGYIVEQNNFKILASAYKKKSDAESVVQNLKNTNTHSSIFVITIPPIEIQAAAKNQKTVISEAVSFHSKIFADLYAISIDIDAGNADIAAIKISLEGIVSAVSGVSERLDSIIGASPSAVLTHIKALYVSIKNLLKTEIITENTFDILVNIRYNYLRILFEYIELIKEINT